MSGCCKIVAKFLGRFSILFFALVEIADIATDVNQTVIYYNYTFTNGTYQKWADQNQNTTGHLETVSPGYFIAACIIWIIPPLTGSIISLIYTKHPLFALGLLMCKQWTAESWTITNAVLGIVLLPIDLVFSSLFVYLLMPALQVVVGCCKAADSDFCGDGDDNTGCLFGNFLPAWKFFLQLCEAAPQFIVAAVFTTNNSAFLKAFDRFVISVVSAVLSGVTLLHGIYKGCKGCREGDDD